MQTEIEVKFLNVNHDAIREKLKTLGATLEQPMRLMRRSIIDYPDRRLQETKDGWIRIRDEGDKVTLTYKESQEHQFGGAKEIETTVESFEKTRDIFLAAELTEHSYQETKRETWVISDVEIVLDEWPWLNPYIEVEGSSEAKVKEVSAHLGFDWKEAVFGSVTTAYRAQYPSITKDEHISKIPRIIFGAPKPEWFEANHK